MRLKKHYRHLFFLFCLSFLGGFSLCAQSNSLKQNQLQCLRYIYNNQFDSAELLIRGFSKEGAADGKLIELFSLRWEFIPIIKSAQSEVYQQKLIELSEKISYADADYNLYRHIVSELLLAEYYYQQGESFKALLHGKRAYPLMVQTFDDQSNNPELLFVQGMYLYYMDFFRNLNFVYRTALFPFKDGDQVLGLQLLEKSLLSPSRAYTEALIYLSHIYLHLEKKPLKALAFSEKLVALYPLNPKFREVLIENYIALGRYSDAAPLLDLQFKNTSDYYTIPALFFKASIEADHLKNQAMARVTFKACIDLSEKVNLHKDLADKAENRLSDFD